MFISPGKRYQLPLARIERNEAFVDAFGQAIPLSLREIKHTDKEGDIIEVFVFTTREKEWRATRKEPMVEIGKIAFLQVTTYNAGAGYVDIGIGEDIVIFPEDQTDRLEEGRRYYFTMYYNELEERLQLTMKIGKLFDNNPPFTVGDRVHFVILDKDQMGRKVLVEGKYPGYLHKNDMLPALRRGDQYVGYIRENEPRSLKVTMYASGRGKVDDAANKIMEMLKNHRGYVRLNDNTPADEIQLRLKMSKSTFKQAVGKLYKERKVEITRRGIKLLKEE